MYPDPDFEYEQKCGHIAMEIEMLILDAIRIALERLNLHNQGVNADKQEPSADTELF